MRTDSEYRPEWDTEICPEDRPCRRKPEKNEERECCEFKKHPMPKKILLECGFNPQDAFFETEHGYMRPHQSFILDRVTVDTSCFCKPLVKLEFSSLIVFEAIAFELSVPRQKVDGEEKIEVELLFELIRNCDCNEEIVQNWKFKKEIEVRSVDKLEVEISEPFTVTACDRVCPDCCVYKMKVTLKETRGIFKDLRVIKPNLSALAQDTASRC